MTRLRDFLEACDGFVEAPGAASARARLYAARLKLIDAGFSDAPFADMTAALIVLADGAAAERRDGRRVAYAEAIKTCLALWRGDLGDDQLTPPSAAPAPIRQYRDD